MSGEGYEGVQASLVKNTQRGDLQIRYGTHTTVAASDTVVTGLSFVLAAFANMEDAPAATAEFATVDIGDQAGTPAAGSILVETWNSTQGAATAFSKSVHWFAVGY